MQDAFGVNKDEFSKGAGSTLKEALVESGKYHKALALKYKNPLTVAGATGGAYLGAKKAVKKSEDEASESKTHEKAEGKTEEKCDCAMCEEKKISCDKCPKCSKVAKSGTLFL